MNSKDIFFKNLAQTTLCPMGIEIDYAKGSFIYSKKEKKYLDMTSGLAVNNLGNNHPKIIKAIKNQVDKHLHVMVYGEFIQQEQNNLSIELKKILPSNLNNYYVLNSGAEANELSIKLCKLITGRAEIISCKKSYHGSTNGALSISGNENKKHSFRPLLPSIKFIKHNCTNNLELISDNTAGVIIEVVQGDAGVQISKKKWLKELKKKCEKHSVILVFDEVQTGFGRTGKNFAFEHFKIIPDILTMGKSLGGGLPIGAVATNKNYMKLLSNNPPLGHITTFGGNPVVCASAVAFIKALKNEINYNIVENKATYLENKLCHPAIKNIRRIGMFFAVELENSLAIEKVVNYCLENGVIIFWFLSTKNAFRLSPPLNISYKEIEIFIKVINKALDLCCLKK